MAAKHSLAMMQKGKRLELGLPKLWSCGRIITSDNIAYLLIAAADEDGVAIQGDLIERDGRKGELLILNHRDMGHNHLLRLISQSLVLLQC
jgi:hypothetical protein